MRKDGIMKNTAMARRLVAGMTLAIAATAGAMPTKQELAEAQAFVQDLTADDMRALKAKEKKPGDVAAAHLALADKAETEAGKYLLLQGAFRLYARGGDYDSAAAVLQRMRTEISDIPPEVVIEIVNKEMSRVASEKAPKVLAIFRDAQRTLKYRKLIVSLEREAKAKPTDTSIRRRIAECHAHLGDWAKALPIFAKLGDAAAKYELDPASAKGLDALKAADFWWNYKAADTDTFKAHAASLYRAAVDGGAATGLRREMAVKRIAEVESSGIAVAATAPATASGTSTPKPVPTSDKQPAATIASTPKASAPVTVKGGPWTLPKTFATPLERSLDLGGGVQMPFCACPAGSFTMMDHKVTITRPFWISKTVVSLNQLAVSSASANYLRSVDNGGSLDKFRKQFANRFSTIVAPMEVVSNYAKEFTRKYRGVLPPGYVFRLPTEAEMYYAYYAGMDEDVVVMPSSDDVMTNTGEALSELGWIPKTNVWDWKSIPRGYGRLATLPDANAFGVVPWSDRLSSSWILDTKNFDANKNTYSGRASKDIVIGKEGIKSVMNYATEEIDPLRTGNHYAEVFVHPANPRRRFVKGHIAYFLIVIGPDLESEKKAAGK